MKYDHDNFIVRKMNRIIKTYIESVRKRNDFDSVMRIVQLETKHDLVINPKSKLCTTIEKKNN